MIDTAKYGIARDALEETFGHARDAATGTFGELTERVRDADLVQQARKRTRKELKRAKSELKIASKQAKKAANDRGVRSASKTRAKRRSPVLTGIVIVIGVAAIAYVMKRRRPAPTSDVAPDPFGNALQEERARGDAHRSHATPGA